jgi:hypothetical protein
VGKRLSGLLVAFAVIFTFASAKADDEKEALAYRLLELANADQFQAALTGPLVAAIGNQIHQSVTKKLSERGVKLEDGRSDELKALIQQRYRALTDEAKNEGKVRLVQRYIETFSKDELLELTAAYQLPAVRRLVDLTPGWTAELTQFGEQYGRENIDRVVYDPVKNWLKANVDPN